MMKYLFLIFVLLFVKTAYAKGEQDPNFKELQTGAMAVVEHGTVFSEPSLTASSKGKFKLGDCFLVVGVITQPVKGGKYNTGTWKWVEVQTPTKTIKGWVSAESIQVVYPGSWKPTEKIDWIKVRYDVASNHFKNVEMAEKFLNRLLKQYPNHKIAIEDEEEGNTANISLSELVPERIAMMYSVSKQYDIAIQKYALLAKKTKSKDKKAHYYFEITRALENDDKDDFKTKEVWYWKIIKEEPSKEISGDEWNAWVDETAASGLMKMLRIKNDEKTLGEAGVKMMKVANNFRVYILGAEAKIEALMADNQYATAKKLLLKTYQKYPSGVSGYFKSDINSTLLIFGAYLNGFDRTDPSRAQKLAAIKELEDMKLEPAVENYIAYQKIVTLDDGPGLKDDLKVPTYNEFYRDMEGFLTRYKYFDPARLERIRLTSNFQIYQATLTDDTFLSLSHDLQDKSIKLSKGVQVMVAYDDSVNDMVKVKTDDGKIGWLNESSIKISHPVPLFPVVAEANYWSMAGGNPGRSYYVPEKPIQNPILLRRIPYFQADEPLVVDVDGDQRPEIITNDLTNHLSVILGDGQGILFKVKDLPTHGVPTYIGGNLLVIGDRGGTIDRKVPLTENIGKWLECVGSDGNKKWEASIGNRMNGLMPDGPYILKDKAYSNRLIDGGGAAFQSFDLETGKVLWSYPYTHSVDFRPLFQGSLAILSVEHNFMDKDVMVVLDMDTQKVLCEIPKLANSILVSNGVIVFHDAKGIQANQLTDGKILWSGENVQTLSNQPYTNMASDGKSLFVFDAVSNVVSLKCFNLSSGKIIWTKTFDKDYSIWPVGRMILVDGALYYLNSSVTLVALDTQTGNDLWKLPLPSSGDVRARAPSVVAAAGHIVVSAGNTLYIVGEKPKSDPQ